MNTYDKLGIRIIHRAGLKGSITKKERFTYDFLVNGTSLYELLGVSKLDMMGRFGKGWTDWNKKSAHIFTLKETSDLENGRTMLYVCPECVDIGCGAITVRITGADGIIEWSEFGYENDYDSNMTDMESYKNVGPYRFNRKQYEEVILKTVSQL